MSLHAVYPAGWLLPQTLDQCGTLWNSLSCRKATTPLQIPSQHTMTASHSVSWEERCLCDQMIKLCWGAVCVWQECVLCRSFLISAVLEQGGVKAVTLCYGLSLCFLWMVWWNLGNRSNGFSIHMKSDCWQIYVVVLTINNRRAWIIHGQAKVCCFTSCHCWSQ